MRGNDDRRGEYPSYHHRETNLANARGRDSFRRHSLILEQATGIAVMLKLAHSESGIAVHPDDLDCKGWLLNCTNGTVNLKTSDLHPHQQTELITRCLKFRFDAEAKCPASGRRTPTSHGQSHESGLVDANPHEFGPA